MGASVDDRKEERIQQLAERILLGSNDPGDVVPIPRDFSKEDFAQTLAQVELNRIHYRDMYSWFLPVRPS